MRTWMIARRFGLAGRLPAPPLSMSCCRYNGGPRYAILRCGLPVSQPDCRPALRIIGVPMSFILALDQGTTSSRALVFDHAGTVRAVAQQEFRQIFPRPG